MSRPDLGNSGKRTGGAGEDSPPAKKRRYEKNPEDRALRYVRHSVCDPVVAYVKWRDNVCSESTPIPWNVICLGDQIYRPEIEDMSPQYHRFFEYLKLFHSFVQNHVPGGHLGLDTVGYSRGFATGNRRGLDQSADKYVWNWHTWLRDIIKMSKSTPAEFRTHQGLLVLFVYTEQCSRWYVCISGSRV